jgi:hypothetical protein
MIPHLPLQLAQGSLLLLVLAALAHWLLQKRPPNPPKGNIPAQAVHRLFVYPIKSCCGVEVKEITIDKRGVVNDRRWMLIDDNNVFVTIRQVI